MEEKTIRKILYTANDFKQFWKKQGPFKYALTSREFPPVLLEPEEWLFSNDLTALLKTLMQWEERKMRIVQAAFNPKKKDVLKPDDLQPWRILNFPEEWEFSVCQSFTPKGHLTGSVLARQSSREEIDIEASFFLCLSEEINAIGYVLLSPEPLIDRSESAHVADYLDEWMADEQEG